MNAPQKSFVPQNLEQNLSIQHINAQKVLIPPIKIQGIKSKLVPHIRNLFAWDNAETYFEPFVGSGVVGFNLAPKKAIFSDSNPHIIAFYNAIKNRIITKDSTIDYLVREGEHLKTKGQEHYLEVRARFNTQNMQGNSGANLLDFLFLNRSCFNGLMRFNARGGFNVPYCKKDNRFAPAYITKIANQVAWVANRIQNNEWEFICCDFAEVLGRAKAILSIATHPTLIGIAIILARGVRQKKNNSIKFYRRQRQNFSFQLGIVIATEKTRI